ncbi:hypothetical protein BGZ95_004029 [Linnemannia exigua]|uniref:Uncharacterized protein n=1 Tax=Linnemannia exigua TaxID=604196 RepID=A0AAD4D3G6_9FUNG|nr:hypothetical protein BGZ95_004029 [Linnemannia exigua]
MVNGQTRRCSKTSCPVFTYHDIDTHLCPYHETYMRGAIFRRQFPDFEGTALLSAAQPVTLDTGVGALDAYLHRHGRIVTVFSGAQLDELTAGLHPAIKKNILRYIQDYLLFLDDSPDKSDILKDSKTHFGARFRQKTLLNGSLNESQSRAFEDECKATGCVFVVEVNPTTAAVEKMDNDGQAGVQGCSIDLTTLSTFPDTLVNEAKCDHPVVLVELLAGIIHGLLVAHQHDIWCPCNPPKGRTHTQVYWFPDESFEEVMGVLRPRIELWLEAFRDVERKIGHLL